jgi:adenine-specific DNA methylase
MNTCPRLIEVALPIREISAESVRDKSLRHGHISTLHLWWARRPLAASRGIVFASLVPDPDDPNCPPKFRDAVVRLLKTKVPGALKAYRRGKDWLNDGDPYRRYDGIPDTPRNRLLTFIAKWSPEQIAFDKGEREKEPKPGEMLDDRSLVKWETSDPENPQGREVLRIARELVSTAYDGKVPTVLDPFSGGGAIPLEATRLGCQAIANDYNPVASMILRASCEFPQKYGKRLVRDVEHWGKWILERVHQRIGHLYPQGKDGQPVVGYLWARTAPCSNPACRAEIPLLRSLLVCDKPSKRVALTMRVSNGQISFGIAKGKAIHREEGTMLNRGDCRCPYCQQTIPVKDLRRAGLEGRMGERMVCVITDTPQGKDYRPVEPPDLMAFAEAQRLSKTIERPNEPILPEITGRDDEKVSNSTGIRVHLYGMRTWGALFNDRQLIAVQSFVSCLHEALAELEKQQLNRDYCKAVAASLGLWVSRNSARWVALGRWRSEYEKSETPFDMAKISMVWDFCEVSPFNEATGGAIGQLDWMLRFVEHETDGGTTVEEITGEVCPAKVLRGDGARLALDGHSLDAVVTDPPYFDEISYADLSDLFYIWQKRALGDVFPETYNTPLTPKTDEATALRHRHKGSEQKAEKHFTSKLAACFADAKRVCKADGIIAVMFAHQTTEAWTALVNALFEAGLNIDATYPVDTELKNRARGLESSALETSITVICRPRRMGAAASFKNVRREIEQAVRESVHRFWNYGFRGADLIVACYGPAVGVFGQHERVERLDGTPVGVPDLLELSRELALKAIAGEFEGDPLSRLYFVWANQYGIAPQSYDDLVKVAQMGTDTENAADLAHQRGLFVADGPTCRLALLRDRTEKKHLGEESTAPLIDKLHHALHLWKAEQRPELVRYLKGQDLLDDTAYWKLAQALFEVLPRGEEDWKLVSALLSERETLQSEAKRAPAAKEEEGRLL